MNNLLRRAQSVVPTGLYSLLKARWFDVKFPHAIQLNITFKCNQRCSYCGIYNDTRGEMTTEQICNMIDEFVEMGTARLSITGGEPFLREDLPDVIDHAHNRGLFVSLATNGSLVAKRIDSLKNVNSVNMTLDGPEAIHDQQRGKGNYKKVLEAVGLFKDNGIPVYLITVITKNNCARVLDILELARSLDVKLLIQPVFYSEPSHANDLEGYRETKYDDSAITETLDELIRLKEQGDPYIILSKRYYKNIREAIINGGKIRCRNAGSLFCTIAPDGRVAPCNLLVRDLRWLNGIEVGFREAFMNMPEVRCGGCLCSFQDFDDLYSLKPDVVWDYYKHYFKFFIRS